LRIASSGIHDDILIYQQPSNRGSVAHNYIDVDDASIVEDMSADAGLENRLIPIDSIDTM
jgi:hypothetical protein